MKEVDERSRIIGDRPLESNSQQESLGIEIATDVTCGIHLQVALDGITDSVFFPIGITGKVQGRVAVNVRTSGKSDILFPMGN